MRLRLSFFPVLACVAASWVMPLPAGAQQQGYLKTKVHPSRAGVFVDGKYLGPAGDFAIAQKYAIDPGEHEVKLQEPRYEEAVEKINVRPGKTTVIRVSMKPRPPAQPPFGLLRVRGGTDKFMPVYVNGMFYGHVDEFDARGEGLKLNPGTYRVKVGDGTEREVTIEANKTSLIQVGKP